MPDNFDDAPETAPETSTEPTEAERRAAELEARNRLLEEEAKRANEAFMQVATQAFSSRGAGPEHEEPEIPVPDRDEDPDGHLKATVARTVQEALKPVGEAIGSYQQGDRKILLETRIDLEKRDMREKYGALWEEHKEQVEKYLGAYPIEQQAAPGAIQEAFNRVFGAAAIERSREETKRAQATIGSGGYTPGAPDAPPPERVRDLSAKEAEFATKGGLDTKRFRAMQGAGRMTIDEYAKVREEAK